MQEPIINQKLPLVFDGVLVVVGGGTVDHDLLKHLHESGAAIVAADGGALACAIADVMPDAIIGDIDSLTDVSEWSAKTAVYRLEEQITTDFEKCIYATHSPVVVALGMTGKRFDHTLAATHVVTKFASKRAIILMDEQDLALGVADDFSFCVKPGDRVSMHPLGAVKFAGSTGLKYSLNGLILAPGILSGTSNEATDGPFSVSVAKGDQAPWLLLLDGHYLDSLIERLLS